MGNKLVLVGGGGHCASVLDSVLTSTDYETVVIVDQNRAYDGKTLLGVPFVGTDDCLPALFEKGFTDAFISLGSVGDTVGRRRLYARLREIGFHIPNLIDKTAAVSTSATLGEGIFVGKNAVIEPLCRIGDNCIIHTAAIIAHGCVIGAFSHIAPAAVLCGEVLVGDDTHIGANAVIRQQITVGKNVMIGAGSTVVKSIADGKTAYGNPCKEV